VYKNGMIVNGLSYITSDELHVYEEGINSDAERLYLNWGEPRAVERIMATVKALGSDGPHGGLIRRNAAGHMHISSSWYGGRHIYRDAPWAWQKPYGFVIMHSPILLGLYNGNPAARGLVTGLVDGLLAHGQQGRMACGISPMTSAGIPMPSGRAMAAGQACRCSRPGRPGGSPDRTSICGPCSGGWCPAIFRRWANSTKTR
jgi:hypothetical protein